MATYFRTAGGNHRHSRQSCALVHKRSLMIGEVSTIADADVASFPPCSYCCADEVQGHAEAVKAVRTVAGRCELKNPIPGSYNPRRVSPRGDCRCGARGVSLVRQTMSLRAHNTPA